MVFDSKLTFDAECQRHIGFEMAGEQNEAIFPVRFSSDAHAMFLTRRPRRV